MNKRFLCLMLAAMLLLGEGIQTFAATKAEVQKQKAETEQRLNEVNKSINAISEKQKEVKAQLSSLDSELVDTMLELEVLNADIEAKEKEIEEAQKEYERYKELEEEQYAAMKLRIQYLYEKGDSDYISMLLEADSLADLLNKAEFVQEVSNYDDQKLTEYEETKNQMEELRITLEAEEQELLEVQADQQSHKESLDKQIANAKSKQKNFETELANAQDKVKEYQETIQEQSELIKKLEEEERRAAEADDAAGGGSGSYVASGSGTGTDIANYGLKFVGYPYVYGGNSLTSGTDCSGFVKLVHQHFGISTPRQSAAIARGGKGISGSELQPGDVVCYPGHVGIYIGNGKIVHASTAKTGIKINNYTYRTPSAFRRYW